MRRSILVIDAAVKTLPLAHGRCVFQQSRAYSAFLALRAENRQLTSPTSRHQQTQSPPAPSNRRPPHRPFTSSAHVLRKGGKQENKRNLEGTAFKTENVDPFDLSELEAGIQRALDRLKDDLSKLRAGGRFNPDTVEALRVQLVKGGKESVRLGDLAQAVPRGGRTIVVLVGEADHIKPITSALLASPYSLNPVPAPHSPLELHIPVPPPTAESRKQAVDAAAKAGEVASQAVRQARGAQQKRLRAMSLGRTAGVDDLKRAGGRMEKVVEGGVGEVKRVVEGARRGLESG